MTHEILNRPPETIKGPLGGELEDEITRHGIDGAFGLDNRTLIVPANYDPWADNNPPPHEWEAEPAQWGISDEQYYPDSESFVLDVQTVDGELRNKILPLDVMLQAQGIGLYGNKGLRLPSEESGFSLDRIVLVRNEQSGRPYLQAVVSRQIDHEIVEVPLDELRRLNPPANGNKGLPSVSSERSSGPSEDRVHSLGSSGASGEADVRVESSRRADLKRRHIFDGLPVDTDEYADERASEDVELFLLGTPRRLPPLRQPTDRERNVTDESKREAFATLSQLGSVKSWIEEFNQQQGTGVDPRTPKVVDELRHNSDLRLFLGERLLNRINMIADKLPERVSRNYDGASKNPTISGYPGVDITSHEYVALLTLSKLDGTFNEGRQDTITSKGGVLIAGMHRIATRQLIDDLKSY